MDELYDRDEFAMLTTVKIKCYSLRYTTFFTIRGQIFFQDVFLINIFFYFYLIRGNSAVVRKRTWSPIKLQC